MTTLTIIHSPITSAWSMRWLWPIPWPNNIQCGYIPGPLLIATLESGRLHLNCTKMENKLDELSHISRCRLRHRSSVNHGNCESQQKAKTAQHSASESRGTQRRESSTVCRTVTNRFTALEATHDAVNPEDLWKGTKMVLLDHWIRQVA